MNYGREAGLYYQVFWKTELLVKGSKQDIIKYLKSPDKKITIHDAERMIKEIEENDC